MTRLVLLVLTVMGALVLLGRRLRFEPVPPAPIDDVDWLREFVIGEHGPEVVVPLRGAYLAAAEWRN